MIDCARHSFFSTHLFNPVLKLRKTGCQDFTNPPFPNLLPSLVPFLAASSSSARGGRTNWRRFFCLRPKETVFKTGTHILVRRYKIIYKVVRGKNLFFARQPKANSSGKRWQFSAAPSHSLTHTYFKHEKCQKGSDLSPYTYWEKLGIMTKMCRKHPSIHSVFHSFIRCRWWWWRISSNFLNINNMRSSRIERIDFPREQNLIRKGGKVKPSVVRQMHACLFMKTRTTPRIQFRTALWIYV